MLLLALQQNWGGNLETHTPLMNGKHPISVRGKKNRRVWEVLWATGMREVAIMTINHAFTPHVPPTQNWTSACCTDRLDILQHKNVIGCCEAVCQQTFFFYADTNETIVSELLAAACGVNPRRVKVRKMMTEKYEAAPTPMTAPRILCTELFRKKKIHVWIYLALSFMWRK